MSFLLTSPAFSSGQPIPRKYSCDGEDISPPLSWIGAPAQAKSFALIVDDPDAPMGIWIHWVLYNIPASCNNLPEAFSGSAQLPDGRLQGHNSWSKLGYGGPCPPSGTHRYYFKLYALDSLLKIASGATKEQLLHTMNGHILGVTELMGTFHRKS